MSVSPRDNRPLVIHVVYRFAVGGLENGVCNLINRMREDRWRHAVVALADIAHDFRARITRTDVHFEAMNKRPGHAVRLYPRLYRTFRRLRPSVVHTRNLAALETVVPAWAAGVPARIHGEHGRDMLDLDGSSVRYRWVRRLYSPFVSRYVALSRDLERYLGNTVGIDSRRIDQIYNGVDTQLFRPLSDARLPIPGCPFHDSRFWIVGSVGRMQAVKDQISLVRAFLLALEREPRARERIRLAIVGEGPLRAQAEALLASAGARDLAWLPGERGDIPEVLRGLDCFALPSLAEGVSNTILEAMACRLPVVATRVGGNGELVEDGVTGRLVPAADGLALATALLGYANAPDVARQHGWAGRRRVEERFSLDHMVARYEALYERAIAFRDMGRLSARAG
jgi:sugar transferase (PEP-CTERM/EpsH1 system associated)